VFGFLLLALANAAASTPVATNALAETPLFRAVTSVDGLPSDAVYALAQDRRGYLWIGTGDGLARFDGVSFAVYQHDPEDPASLSSNVVQALHIDARDRVWVGTEGGGLSLLRANGEGFVHYRRERPAPIALDDVWAITSDAEGAVWFGGFGGGLYRLDADSGAVRAFRHDPTDPTSLASDHVLTLAIDAAGTLWVGGAAGVDRWTGSAFDHVSAASEAAMTISLTADNDGGLWIGRSGGLDYRNADGHIRPAAERAGLSNSGVTGVLRDRQGTLWIATRGGLNRFVDGELRRLHGTPRPSPALVTGPVLAMLEDHEGGLWFATLGAGLARLAPGWRNFSVLQPDEGRQESLSAVPRGMAAALADGYAWAVGNGGVLDRVELATGRVERRLQGAGQLTDRRLWSVLQTGDGALWVGHQTGLLRLTADGGALRHWRADGSAPGLPAGPIDLLIDDGNGGLWLSANGHGIEQRDARGNRLARHLPNDGSGLTSGDIDQLGIGPDGALWIAGAGGILRRDAASGEIKRLAGGPAERVHAFAFAADGGLWTMRLGALERYALVAGDLQRQEQLGAQHGLPAVEAGSLLLDAEGGLWITTARGLLHVDPRSRRVRSFGVRDGLPSREFSNRPALRLDDGRMLAATAAGLVMFDPARLSTPTLPPRLHIERIDVRRAGLTQTLAASETIHLEHDDSELHFSLRLLSFADPAAHRYRFRLQGIDSDWIDGGASGERRYPSLPAGRFRFEASAAGVDGVWLEPPLTLEVNVAAAWWDSAPARLLWLLALLAAFWLAWRWQRARLLLRHREAQRLREHQWAEQASAAKSEFLAIMGHEIRTPMTGVLGMTELLLRSPLEARERRYAEAIDSAGRVMLRLLNDALDLARIEAGKLELLSEPFDLQVMLDSVDRILAPQAEHKGLHYQSLRASTLPGWVVGDAVRLQQVLLNLGSNAIKFSEVGNVYVRASGGPGALSIEVSDQGPGISVEQQTRLFERFVQADGAVTAARHGGSGLGLAISRQLVTLMGGNIRLHSALGEGARFTVELPLAVAEPPVAPVTPVRIMPTEGSPSTGLRILLVEDDATVAEVVSALLAVQGHDVSTVGNGLAALGAATTGAFDLGLLDLDLPGIDGLSLAPMLRTSGCDWPLIALTARADPGIEDACREAGMRGFLRKPVDSATLAAALQAAMACPSAQASAS